MANKPDNLDALMSELEGDQAPADQPITEDEIADILAGVEEVGDDAAPETSPEFTLSPPPALEPLTQAHDIDPSTQVVKKAVTQVATDDAVAAIMDMIAKVRAEFDEISDKVYAGFLADRAQIQQTIAKFDMALGDNPNGASRPVVEGLVQLLDTQVNSNMQAIKLLEVKTKLLMALKSSGSVIINQNNSNGGGGIGQNSELTEILSSPDVNDLDD